MNSCASSLPEQWAHTTIQSSAASIANYRKLRNLNIRMCRIISTADRSVVLETPPARFLL